MNGHVHNEKSSGKYTTLFVVLGILLLGFLIPIVSYVTNYNYGNEAEKSIKAKYTNNQNIRSSNALKVLDAVKMPREHAATLKDILATAMTAQYGSEGSRATMQWFHGQGITLDTEMWKKVQDIIVSGRNEFEVSQTALIDACRVYETNRGYLWKGMWLRIAGYPTNLEEINKMCTPVISANTKKIFESGEDTTDL